jgi:uncharacterized protein DUF1874
MFYLANSFSLNMLDGARHQVVVEPLTLEAARYMAQRNHPTSVIGHETTAAVVQDVLDYPVEFNRISVRLRTSDQLLVAQYIGPRLPEGATELPPGAHIDFFYVQVR